MSAIVLGSACAESQGKQEQSKLFHLVPFVTAGPGLGYELARLSESKDYVVRFDPHLSDCG